MPAHDTLAERSGLRHLLTAAAAVVVIAGLKEAQAFIVPILFATFLSLLCIPPMRRLQTHGVPAWLAIVIVFTVATILVVLVAGVIGRSAAEFQAQLPAYQQRLDAVVGGAIDWLQDRGIEVERDSLTSSIDSGAILALISNTATSMLAALSNLLLVILTMLFMLFEAQTLPGKLRSALGKPDDDLSDFRDAATRVQKYLAIKAIVSLATGLCVIALCVAFRVDFPLLWGLIAFLFNFVPNIGSIIAAIPAVMLALLQHGFATAGAVALGYVAINGVLGNMIEPRMMGQRLGLSTLVVFLSMLFWGWVWGPLGMLLSVPLTVIVKITLEHSTDLRWIAILLGPGSEPHLDEHIPDQP